jgi:Flp pilus assembly protein CpaB
MNPPRLKLSRLTPAPQPQAGNGQAPPPRVRPRAQPGPVPVRSAAARRLLAPLPLAGIALIILALILDLGVLAAGSKRTPVLLATHALPAGTVLSSSDVRTGQLAGEASVLATLVPQREHSQVIGQRLSSAVPAGAPLPAGALAGSQAKSSALVLSAPEFDVTGAQLQAGDRVTVLATFGAGSGQVSTRAVARGLEVLSVGEAGANADASTTTVPVTVAVEEASLASSLALANEDAKLDLLLEGAGASTATIPPASEASAP